MKIKKTPIPQNSILGTEINRCDYFDCFAGEFISHSNIKIDQFAAVFFKIEIPWIIWLMKLRNFLVKPFGVKTGDGFFESKALSVYALGDKIGPWAVYDRSDNEIIMGDKDSHLDFKVSLLLEQKGDNSLLSISTMVFYKSLFGRIYFFVIKPFHMLILRAFVRSIIKKIQK